MHNMKNAFKKLCCMHVLETSDALPIWCHCLLQGIFPTQGSNPGLPHCRQILYQLSHKGSPSLEVFHYKTAPGDTKGEAAGYWVLLALTLSELGPREPWAPQEMGAGRRSQDVREKLFFCNVSLAPSIDKPWYLASWQGKFF